jgi:hypothetical protein
MKPRGAVDRLSLCLRGTFALLVLRIRKCSCAESPVAEADNDNPGTGTRVKLGSGSGSSFVSLLLRCMDERSLAREES